jgi:hypothetical protein
MTMVVAVPAMPPVMVLVADINRNLCTCRRNQRSEEHQKEETKHHLLHA